MDDYFKRHPTLASVIFIPLILAIPVYMGANFVASIIGMIAGIDFVEDFDGNSQPPQWLVIRVFILLIIPLSIALGRALAGQSKSSDGATNDK